MKYRIFRDAILILVTLCWIFPANSFELKVVDDEQFNNRDPVTAAKSGLVTTPFSSGVVLGKGNLARIKVRRVEKRMTVNGGTFKYLATGALRGNSNITVIFLHGRGGDRHLGFSDHRFEGNFKLIKDLMYQNDGIYISTDVTNFGERGRKSIGALVSYYRKKTEGKLVVACGSMGSFVCWQLAKDKKSAEKIDAYMFLGGFPDPDYLSSGNLEILKGKPALYFSHGSRDTVYDWKYANRYSKALRRKSPRYPVKLSLIRGGQHGEPIKKVDWFNALKWIIKN